MLREQCVFDALLPAHKSEFFLYMENLIEQCMETDEEAEKIGVPAFVESREHIAKTRDKLNTAEEMSSVSRGLADPRFGVEHALIYGSPDTVSERIARLEKLGMGGIILHFRVGPLSWEDNENSLRLFADRVMPNFR